MTNNELVIANMATIPERIDTVCQVIDVLLPQVDEFNIVLNKFTGVPLELNPYILQHRRKINVYIHQDNRFAERAKFLFTQKSCYYFTVDDDIIYPPDYVEKMVNCIERYQRKAMITVHANNLKQPFDNYYKSRECFLFRAALDRDRQVEIPGTGTMAYHTSAMDIKIDMLKSPFMSDIWIGYFARKCKVPVIAIARENGWLKAHFRQGIYEAVAKDQELLLIQTAIIKSMLKN